MSPRDNFDTSPQIIKIRKAGGVARLNLEIAMQKNDRAPGEASAAAVDGALGVASADIAQGVGNLGGGGFPCFLGDTLIFTVERMVVPAPISQIKPGQTVLGFDQATLSAMPTVVTESLIHEALEFLRFEFADGRALQATHEHLIWDGETFRAASAFDVGGQMFDLAFNGVEIANIYTVKVDKPVLVYNLHTALETYFANGLAVHNAKQPIE